MGNASVSNMKGHDFEKIQVVGQTGGEWQFEHRYGIRVKIDNTWRCTKCNLEHEFPPGFGPGSPSDYDTFYVPTCKGNSNDPI
jgi:hypothetical protein